MAKEAGLHKIWQAGDVKSVCVSMAEYMNTHNEIVVAHIDYILFAYSLISMTSLSNGKHSHVSKEATGLHGRLWY